MRTKKAPILIALAVSFIFVSGIFSISEAIRPQVKDKKDKKEQDKQERGIRIKSVKELPAKAKRFALVIGIDQYNDPQINKLDGAANDAKAIAEALVTYSGFPQDQVILLTNNQPQSSQPTKNTILRKLSNLTEVAVPKDGLLLLFFAGHGIEKKGQAFLLPSDAELSGDVKLLEATAINVKTVYDWIQDSGIQQIMLILDACRNNPEMGRGEESEKLTKSYTKNFDFDTKNSDISAFVTLYASELGQTAYEYKEKKHGYFTWSLIEAMKGGAANEQGEVTLAGLRKYLQENVPKLVSMDLGLGKRQRPFAEIKGYKAEELVFSWVKPAETKPPTNIISIDPSAKEIVFWDTIKDYNIPAYYQAYLDKYPNGEFAAIARIRLENLQSQQAIANQPQTPNNSSKPPIPVEKVEKPSVPVEKVEKVEKPVNPNPAPSTTPPANENKGKKSKSKSVYIPKTRSTPEEAHPQTDKQQAKDSEANHENSTQIAAAPPEPKDSVDEVKPKPPLTNDEKLKLQTDKEEKLLWDNLADSTNPDDYKLFLNSFPKGKYAEKATDKISELTELADWNAVKETSKKDDVRNFLAKYPKSQYAKQANARLSRIDEDAHWNSIKDSQGLDNFKTYLITYPKGAYVELARARIKELTSASKSQPSAVPANGHENVSIPPPTKKQPEATASVKTPEPTASPKNEVKTYIENSEKFIREKRWKEATEMVNRAIKLEPETAEWHNRLGVLLAERKQWDDAELELIKAVQLEAKNARWHNSLGLFFSSRDRHLEAINACRRASELEPANAKYHADFSQVLLNQYDINPDEFYNLKNNPALKNRLQRIDDSGILRAESEARQALSIEPQNPTWHLQLIKVLIWLNKWADAESQARQALQLNLPNAQLHNQLGLILLVQEKFSEAEIAFREAARLEPSNSAYKANLKKAQQK